jgi:hypothetical protein
MPNFSGIWTVTQQMQATGQSIWPVRPGTPTIGTATVANPTSASVTFTAGSTGYPTTVTFTATSSPGGITGTGSSSPVTVTGLTTGTAYTFTVTATNATGTSPASAASNSVTPDLPAIGSVYGGGYFAGQISTAGNGVADFNLVIGPVASAQATNVEWKLTNTSTAGTSSVIDGPTNSANMNNASHPAAQFCEGRTIGGYSDWYMPAKNELEVCYYNLKPTATGSNNTASGINTNAVPSRSSNYTTSVPPQTSATIFQVSQSQAFASLYYWSSTEVSAGFAAIQFLYNGLQSSTYKFLPYNVRAVRRVAV